MNSTNRELTEIAAAYLHALRAGDQVAALVLIREALTVGFKLCDLYRDVLQPALYEIGQRWEHRLIDVADEHRATAITWSVMEQCAAREKPLPSGPPLILATCVGPELHDLGLRMISDCLEIAGWHTLYLGSNMPLDAIVTLAVRARVTVVAASVTLGPHTLAVRDLAWALRASAIGSTVKLLVGGAPFNRLPDLWRQVGADGMARDAVEAVAWVECHVCRERSADAGYGSLGTGAREV